MNENTQFKGSHNLHDAANAALFIAAFLGVWQIIFMLGIWPKISLPSPILVAENFAKIIWNGSLPQSIGITLARLIGAFTISATLGILIGRSEEHTSELQSRLHLVCRLLLEKKK